MKAFNPNEVSLTKYLFYTGKGGVGKTSTACATAVTLADGGKKILLISTDPASNLQDVFKTELTNKATVIQEVPNLSVANLDPIQAAEDYKESIIAPLRGTLPEEILENMSEQLSGSCTVEISAFNEFANFITDDKAAKEYDHIIFDTAPTGHTLRMLQLPSAWSDFIKDESDGTARLGQLSGMGARKAVYEKAVKTLSDGEMTTLMLISRPENTPLLEAKRASDELYEMGIENQKLVINGVLDHYDDEISKKLYQKQQDAISSMPVELKRFDNYFVPLRGYNVYGLENIRDLLVKDKFEVGTEQLEVENTQKLRAVIDDLYESNKKVIFTMGKGGVGKTSIAAAIAMGLAEKGKKVHLTTTDPADHLKYIIHEQQNISMSHIDEQLELEKYKQEVLSKARETMSKEDLAYVEEDLRSPCTQEIAVFRAFANVVEKSEDQIVIIDTAPTGHTLLLLDSTQSYHREIEHSQGEIPESVKKLLPKLRNSKETEVIIVTLAETTPVYEAIRLQEDLQRAHIHNKWWIINSSMFATNTTNKILQAKSKNEIQWINKVNEVSNGNFAVIQWFADEIKNETIHELMN